MTSFAFFLGVLILLRGRRSSLFSLSYIATSSSAVDVGLIHPLIVSGRIVLPTLRGIAASFLGRSSVFRGSVHFPLFLSFDQFGRWFEEIGSVFVGLLVRRKERCVKHVAIPDQLPETWGIHDVFHASLLTPYKETDEHGTNFLEPPPELIEGEEEWEVEQILGNATSAEERSRNTS